MTSKSTTGTASETIPRTANLLPCKQWWRVCFLYGDQEKYYRQVYGKAASERIASATSQKLKTKSLIEAGIHLNPSALSSTSSTTATTTAISSSTSTSNAITLFPFKQPSRRRSKQREQQSSEQNGKKSLSAAEQHEQQLHQQHGINETVKPNRKITVLDDPFLFGVNEHANLSEDSGIDNAAFEHNSIHLKHKKKIDRTLIETNINRDLCNDLKINESDLKMLHMSRRNRCGVAIPLESKLNDSICFMSETEDVNNTINNISSGDRGCSSMNECGIPQGGQSMKNDPPNSTLSMNDANGE